MFDMSWGEILTIGAVALIVIGPKDLPRTLRAVGQMTGKLRRMAGDFQSQFQDALREADMPDIRASFQEAKAGVEKSFSPLETVREDIRSSFSDPLTPTSQPGALPNSLKAEEEFYGPYRDPLRNLLPPSLPDPDDLSVDFPASPQIGTKDISSRA
jgi:sec-independent protein translocase protein TatB